MAKKLCKPLKNKDLQIQEGKIVDYFGKGRITIPCLCEDRVLNMTGRLCYESSRPEVPKYSTIGSYMLMSPDSCVMDMRPLYLCEGPIDKLIIEQMGFKACCLMGTPGYSASNYFYWFQFQKVFGMPDVEDKTTAREANLKTYIAIAESAQPCTVRIIHLPRSGNGKVDPASYFAHRNPHEAGEELARLSSKAPRIETVEAWGKYQEEKREKAAKKAKRCRVIQSGDRLRKFPIRQTLEILGIEIEESLTGKPVCRCFNPKHEVDEHPSLYIYEETETFHCFGCKAGVDAIDAVRMVKGMTFLEAVKFLKEAINEQETNAVGSV
jgi:hypothetical protein